jgi:hypothetical protein
VTTSTVSTVAVRPPPVPLAPPRWPRTATESNWLLALGFAVGLAALFAVVSTIEHAAVGRLARRQRFIWHYAETSTRFLAIAHTIVATLFLATSSRLRNARGRLWMLGLGVLGVLACLAFSGAGGEKAPLAAVLFYTYFVAHEVRDEAFFYRVNGDAPGPDPATRARHARLAAVILWTALATTFSIGFAFGIGGARRFDGPIDHWTLLPRAGLALAILATAFGVLAFAGRRAGLRGRAEWRAYLATHRPIVFVYVGAYVVLFAGMALTGRMYAIVAVHVLIWWVFALRQMAKRPASPRPRALTWRWFRDTPLGFNVLHAGVLVAVVAAAAVWAFAFRNDPRIPAMKLLSKEAFPYWTLMHVSLSWVPRPG